MHNDRTNTDGLEGRYVHHVTSVNDSEVFIDFASLADHFGASVHRPIVMSRAEGRARPGRVK